MAPKTSTIFVQSSWNLVKMIGPWGEYFHQVSWGLDQNCRLFTDGQFLSMSVFSYSDLIFLKLKTLKTISSIVWWHAITLWPWNETTVTVSLATTTTRVVLSPCKCWFGRSWELIKQIRKSLEGQVLIVQGDHTERKSKYIPNK